MGILEKKMRKMLLERITDRLRGKLQLEDSMSVANRDLHKIKFYKDVIEYLDKFDK